MVTVGEDFIKSKGFQNKLQSLIDESDLSVLTPKQIRHDLEEHYGLDRDTLRQDPWKTMIGELIDNCVTKKLEQKEKVKETTEKRDASPKKRKSSTEDDKKEDKAPRKRAKKAETISSDEVEEEFMASEEEDDKEKKEESEREEEDEDEDPVETNVVKSKKSAASVSVKGVSEKEEDVK
ncbi:hypothetical protein RO3G_04246 [Rhizopus delemar RA 99-880]|uniref:DEK-C domain-containing protein n=1 Tax=Rhizopus delemar (strain RA 99-880 / ATCC MYA-4621 / FGSC 9543 / NRRL 43880) TaxID=246409 RepID=I1BTL1_RHIO9|nr:hypothetical protein RO3G_04246 [Rhizopus delemar RA 99-880]|eukprot:EIE79541.1 hypothetical protein RO3G_04246 [Rhizopus delemar RA 99-880]